jgi:hypothetical protein
MSFLAELLDFRLFFLAAMVFVPLERLVGATTANPSSAASGQTTSSTSSSMALSSGSA